MNQEEFDKCRNNEGLRRAFLGEIYRELILPSEYGRYVSSLEYRKEIRYGFMSTIPSLLSLLGVKGRKSRIAVSSGAFYEFDSWADFFNILTNHEGTHAKQNFFTPRTLLDCVVDFVGFTPRMITSELEAHRNELVHINSSNSSYYLTYLEAMIASYHQSIDP